MATARSCSTSGLRRTTVCSSSVTLTIRGLPGNGGLVQLPGSPRIVNVTLDEHTVVRRSPEVEHERAVAIFDLLEENHFAPHGDDRGPYRLSLAIVENRLAIGIEAADGSEIAGVALPLNSFRRLIKD